MTSSPGMGNDELAHDGAGSPGLNMRNNDSSIKITEFVPGRKTWAGADREDSADPNATPGQYKQHDFGAGGFSNNSTWANNPWNSGTGSNFPASNSGWGGSSNSPTTAPSKTAWGH